MTTEAAEAAYKAAHVRTHQGRSSVVFNPNSKPAEELRTIYGFHNGGRPGWFQAVLLSDDGEELGCHICSDEAYMPADLGILEGTRPDRHETFRAHYPDGYRMEFVWRTDLDAHEGFQAALKRGLAKAEERP